MASPQTQQDKLLRVGIIQGDRILEERHLNKANVTIGHGAKNTIVLPPSDDMPAQFAVFEKRKNQYQLIFDDTMHGRVHLGSSDVDFDTIRKQGLAQERGTQYVLPLQDIARGKVELADDFTLFFQFVAPVPASERVKLPADVQGGFWKTMDRVFFAILATSLLVHFAWGAFIFSSAPPPEPELALDELEDRFVKANIIPQKQPEPEQVAEAPQAAEEAPKQEDKKPASDTKQDSKPQDAAQHKAEVVKKVSGKGLLRILGSSGSGNGAFADVLGGSTGGGEIAQALAGAGGVGVATSEALGANGPKGGVTHPALHHHLFLGAQVHLAAAAGAQVPNARHAAGATALGPVGAQGLAGGHTHTAGSCQRLGNLSAAGAAAQHVGERAVARA